MPPTKRLLPIVGTLIILFFVFILCISTSANRGRQAPAIRETKVSKNEVAYLKEKSKACRSFAKQKDYNDKICFLINMELPSGHNRFFVYDMEKQIVLNSNLVAHGRCNQNWLEGRKFGNAIGCGCTSLGKYRIGQSYKGKFGQAYKLHGLDSSNSNAFNRFVVLHSYWAMRSEETEEEICQSDGCPMVSKKFLEELKPVIDESKKPILLWIFD